VATVAADLTVRGKAALLALGDGLAPVLPVALAESAAEK